MQRRFSFLLLVFVFAWSALPACAETKVETVRSKGGIEAWLVQDATVPIIAVSFGFMGGSTQDPKGKEGLTQFMCGLFDEGAGPYDSRAFQEKLQTLAISLSFGTDRDFITGSLRTLSANRKEAFELLRLALNQPHFDKVAVERVRGQIAALQKSRANDAAWQAAYAFSETAYPNHPYGQRTVGTEQTVRAITRDDIVGASKRLLARNNLKIAVVGDITADELSKTLDDVFGALPEKAALKPVEEIRQKGEGRVVIVPLNGPQSRIQFGIAGPKRKDADFMASFVLNQILGGDTFSSRLYKEIREKKGYTYGVYTELATLDHSASFVGSMATRNEVAGDALKLVNQEVARFVKEGPAADELENIKAYLIGSYPLHFDTTGKIAGLLLGLQLDDFPASYITEREQLIRAVKADDVRKAAQKIFSQPFLTVIAGAPKGVEAK